MTLNVGYLAGGKAKMRLYLLCLCCDDVRWKEKHRIDRLTFKQGPVPSW